MNLHKAARSFLQTPFFLSSTVIFAGSFLVNVLNYVFTLILSRMMGVEAFGEVTAMLSLLLVISVPSSALSMLMTREVASRSADSHTHVRDLFFYLQKNINKAAFVLWVVVLLASPWLADFLHIGYLPLGIFTLLVPLAAIGALQSGTLQGLQEFFMLSKQSVLSAIVKLGISIVLVLAGFSVAGVMVALVLAQLLSWWYGRQATKKAFGAFTDAIQPTFNSTALRTLFFAILCTTFLLTLLSNIDVLLAKHFLSAALAGEYGALSTVGKIIIYGIGAFTTVLLPMAAAAHALGKGGERRILALSIAVIIAASLVAVALFSLFPTFIVLMLLGAKYQNIASHLGLFALAMGCVSVATTLINYFVAVRNTSFMYLLGLSIVVEVVLISLHHASVGDITSMLAVSSALLLGLMTANYFFIPKSGIGAVYEI